jgi:hypothetical protein
VRAVVVAAAAIFEMIMDECHQFSESIKSIKEFIFKESGMTQVFKRGRLAAQSILIAGEGLP